MWRFRLTTEIVPIAAKAAAIPAPLKTSGCEYQFSVALVCCEVTLTVSTFELLRDVDTLEV